MSQTDVKRLFEALTRDESLKAKVEAAAAKHADKQLDESQREAIFENEIVPLAKSEGFEFTLEDVKAYQASRRPGAGKLTDEELDAVVGGAQPCMCVAGGGGTGGDGIPTCVCVLYGQGNGSDGSSDLRCLCAVYGFGDDD